MIYTGEINLAFQKILGRNPTDAEMKEFMALGNSRYVPLEAQDVERILQGLPEVQEKNIERYGGLYENRLRASDDYLLNRSKDVLTSQFAQMGRNPTGSGYVNAYAQAAAALAKERQNVLADYYGRGYSGIYQGISNRSQDALERGYGSLQRGRDYDFQVQDYYRQQNAFNDYLNAQNRRNRNQALVGFGGTLGGASLGAGLGFAAGGPLGMFAGGLIGSQLGGRAGGFAQ